MKIDEIIDAKDSTVDLNTSSEEKYFNCSSNYSNFEN